MLAILCKNKLRVKLKSSLFRYFQTKQVLAEFQLKITKIGDDIAKKQILPQTWVIFGPSFAQIVSKYPNLKEFPNFLIYNMEMQVRTKFKLKVTMICEDIAKKGNG